MFVGPQLIGLDVPPALMSWTEKDCRIYALGVGAGMQDPAEELAFTTENSNGVPMRVLPTFGLIPGCSVGVGNALRLIPDFDWSSLLHGEQKIEQHKELPVEGSVKTSACITAVWDKGSAAVIETESVVADAVTAEPYVTCSQSLFLRGYGGWGGARGPSGAKPAAGTDRNPDFTFTFPTQANQALLYRLSGDRNPLHSDPSFARKAGFDRPILHGLCAFGAVSRVLLRELANADPANFRSIGARFSSPTYPGDELTVSVYRDGSGFDFHVCNQAGQRLLGNGRFETKN
jgi:acyl dehydratase